jgi:hypothetical protein
MDTLRIEAMLSRYWGAIQKGWALSPQRFKETPLHPTPNHEEAIAHTLCMVELLRERLSDPAQAGKNLRWLGFIQGALWGAGVMSIQDMLKGDD